VAVAAEAAAAWAVAAERSHSYSNSSSTAGHPAWEARWTWCPGQVAAADGRPT